MIDYCNLKKFTVLIVVILVIQLAYGAFMAGLKAAPAAPTWPDMNGSYMPANFSNYNNNQITALCNQHYS